MVGRPLHNTRPWTKHGRTAPKPRSLAAITAASETTIDSARNVPIYLTADKNFTLQSLAHRIAAGNKMLG